MIRPVFQRRLGAKAEQALLLQERQKIENNLLRGRVRRTGRRLPSDASSWYTLSEEDETSADEMPLRMSMNNRRKATKQRRNATTHKAHGMSLMQGILSVANGEGESPAADLKSQNVLPRYLSSGEDKDGIYTLPDAAFKPLPDPDEYYQQKTYVVVNKQGVIFRFTEAKALFMFGKNSKLRQMAINLFIHPLFSTFIMLVIIANCICMMLAEPPPWIEDYLEYVFTAIYSFEALVKIIGHGFVLHRFTYLRDYWNWLDFIVIVSAYITEILKAAVSESSVGQLSVLRAFRVLRALKTMSVVPGLRGIVKALLRSIHALKDAVVLTIFCLSVFALIGYQLFHGTLRHKCVLQPGTLKIAPDAYYEIHFNSNNSQFSPYSEAYTNSNHKNAYFKYPNEPLNNMILNSTNDLKLYPMYATSVDFSYSNNSTTRNNLFYSLTSQSISYNNWTKSDAFLLGNITEYVNSTNTKWNATNRSNTSSCQDISLCLTSSILHVVTGEDSSILNLKSFYEFSQVSELWTCQSSSPNNGKRETRATYSFHYETENIQQESTNSTCNVTVTLYAADIRCLNHVITNRTNYCPNNMWSYLLQHLDVQVPRKEAKQRVILFDVIPNSASDQINFESTTPHDFNGYVFYQEYNQYTMPKDAELLWDNNENNYVMNVVNPLQFYYFNSSNIPGEEPRYCIIGDESMCPDGYICREAGSNPDYGYTNFDHFFWAFLTSFRLIAQDAWSRLYYLTLHTIGMWYVIFYILIMFLGSYYLINLILAVVYMAYEEQQAVVEEEELEAQEREAEKKEQQKKAQAKAEGRTIVDDSSDSGGHSEADLIQPRSSRYKKFRRRHWKRTSSSKECTCGLSNDGLDAEDHLFQKRPSLYSECSTVSNCSCNSINHTSSSESSFLRSQRYGINRNRSCSCSVKLPSSYPVFDDGERKVNHTCKNPFIQSEGECKQQENGNTLVSLPVPEDTTNIIDSLPPQGLRRKSILRKSSEPSDKNTVEAEVNPNWLSPSPLQSSNRSSAYSGQTPILPTLMFTSPSNNDLADKNFDLKNSKLSELPTVFVTSVSKETLSDQQSNLDATKIPENESSKKGKLYASCDDIRSNRDNATCNVVTSSDICLSQHPKNLSYNMENERHSLAVPSKSNSLYGGVHKERSVSFCEDSDLISTCQINLPPPTLKRKRFLVVKQFITDNFGKWLCCSPVFHKFQLMVRSFVLDPFMDLFITLCIVLNTIFMMLEHHPMDSWFQNMLETANQIFTGIFVLEMVLKILGLTPYVYFKERWNMFDASIVIFSLLELLLQKVQGLSVLRTFRLLRILKLAKAWPTLNKLLVIIGRTVGKLWHLTCVFLLVLFIFAVVGMQLLRSDYEKEYKENMPRWNFFDFPHAFMVVFRIQCGEWIENMFTCMSISQPAICIPLFILVYIIGNLVILNLFLALLLNSFSGDALQRAESETNSISLAMARIRHWSLSIRNAIISNQVISDCCSKLRRQICLAGDSEKHNKSTHDVALKQITTNSEVSAIDDSITLPTSANGIAIKSITGTFSGQENNNNLLTDHENTQENAQENITNGITRKNNLYRYRHKRTCPLHPVHRTHVPGCRYYKTTFSTISCNSIGNPGNTRRQRHRPGFAPASAFQNSDEMGGLEPLLRTVSADPKNHKTYTSSALQKTYNSDKSVGELDKSTTDSLYIENEDFLSQNIYKNNNFTNKKSQNYINNVQNNSSISLPQSLSPLPINNTEELSDLIDIKSPLLEKKNVPATKVPIKDDEEKLNDKNTQNGQVFNQSISGSRHMSKSSLASIPSSNSVTKNNSTKSMLSHDEEKQEQEKKKVPPLCFPRCWPHENLETGKWRNIRVFFNNIVNHRYFENVVIFCIMFSSVSLAFEDVHLYKNPKMKHVLYILDVMFCIFFAIEMLMKWVGLGLRWYFTNYWCWLDFFIVAVSIFNLVLSAAGFHNLGALRVLRTFRAFRPLRALSRFQGMKVVVDALLRAIPSIGQVFMVCMIFWLIFSILGVNLFMGRFGRCVSMSTRTILSKREDSGMLGLQSANDDSFTIPQCHYNLSDVEEYHKLREMDPYAHIPKLPAVKNRLECEACALLLNTTDIVWDVPKVNFDNVLHGYLALLQIATFKGWLEIMNNAIDISGVDIEEQPKYESSFYFYLYFVIFIVCGAFFSLNLFIGVIIDNFNEQKKDSSADGGVFLTDEQKKYYNAMKKMSSKSPSKPIPRPESAFANKIYDIVTDRKFEIAVMGLILLNMVVMAIEHHEMSAEMNAILQYFNMGFIGIFIVEAILKLIGLRLYYFTITWNVFDIVVVVVSLVASALSDLVAQYFLQPTLLRIIRLFRVTRILRLIREAKGIRTLLFALMMSLPALFNIGSLLFLVIFIFAILGMSQFAYVQKTGGIDELLNFETFPNSFLVLFQVSTSEGWNTFIDPILKDTPPHCDPTIHNPDGLGNGNCGNYTLGTLYFITFVLMTFLIVINMYIAIILENFEVATRESAEPLTADDFEQFFEVWQRYDDRLTQYIAFEQLQDLLHHLDFPLRVPYPNTAFIAVSEMRITLDGKIHCLEVVIALIKKVLGDPPELNQFKETMLESFKLKSGAKDAVDPDDTISTMEFVRRLRAAIIIQRYYRQYVEREVLRDYNSASNSPKIIHSSN